MCANQPINGWRRARKFVGGRENGVRINWELGENATLSPALPLGSPTETIPWDLQGLKLVTIIWLRLPGLRHDVGVTEEEMGGVVRKGCRDTAFRPEEVGTKREFGSRRVGI